MDVVMSRTGRIANRRFVVSEKHLTKARAEIIRRYGTIEVVTIAHGDSFAVYFEMRRCPDCRTEHGALPCPARDGE